MKKNKSYIFDLSFQKSGVVIVSMLLYAIRLLWVVDFREVFQPMPSLTQKCECEKISVLLWKNINL